MAPANARSLLALRPVSVLHRLEPRSEACPLSLRDVLRALEGRRGTLPLLAAPFGAVARGALLAAKEARAVVGFAAPPGCAPEPWFASVARAADEVAPRLPFFLSAEVRVEEEGDAMERAFAVAHRLMEAGLTHLAIDVTAVAPQRRAQAAAEVAGEAAERELGIEAVLPAAIAEGDPEPAVAFVDEFEGLGVRADVVSARLPAADKVGAARAQLAALDALGRALGGRPVLRRGPLSRATLAEASRSSLRLLEDGGAALAAGLRALPDDLRGAARTERPRELTLSGAVSERLEALVYAEVAALLEELGAGGTVGDLAGALERGR